MILSLYICGRTDEKTQYRMGKQKINKRRKNEEFEKYYRLPANRRLKYIALGVISVVVVLQAVMIIWMNDISVRQMLIMRGCVGAGALVFVIVCAILLYRVYNAYLHDKDD